MRSALGLRPSSSAKYASRSHGVSRSVILTHTWAGKPPRGSGVARWTSPNPPFPTSRSRRYVRPLSELATLDGAALPEAARPPCVERRAAWVERRVRRDRVARVGVAIQLFEPRPLLESSEHHRPEAIGPPVPVEAVAPVGGRRRARARCSAVAGLQWREVGPRAAIPHARRCPCRACIHDRDHPAHARAAPHLALREPRGRALDARAHGTTYPCQSGLPRAVSRARSTRVSEEQPRPRACAAGRQAAHS